jgi:hypothetical protein
LGESSSLFSVFTVTAFRLDLNSAGVISALRGA